MINLDSEERKINCNHKMIIVVLFVCCCTCGVNIHFSRRKRGEGLYDNGMQKEVLRIRLQDFANSNMDLKLSHS